MQGKILVIAYKFNDIFYAISTCEFKTATNKTLLILNNNIDTNLYPYQNKFDKIISIKYKASILGMLLNIYKTRKSQKLLKAETVILSNPVLLISQYIMKISKCKYTIYVEDGIMNYYNFTPSNSWIKKMAQRILEINDLNTFKKINRTYLLSPEDAIFYFGKKIKINLNLPLIDIENQIDLNNKSIFVGQNLYAGNFISIDEYNYLVNDLINRFKIDYYLPHPYASIKEEVNKDKLNLNKISVTLEVLSNKYTFKVYSFCSSLLYTTKLLNENIECYIIKTRKINLPEVPFLEKNINGIIEI